MSLFRKPAQNREENRVQYNPDTLLLQESVALSVRDRSGPPHHLVRLLLTLTGLIGSFWSFDGFFHPGWNLKYICLFLVGFAVLTRVLYRISRFGTLLLLGETAAVCGLLLKFMDQAAEGAYSIFRTMSLTITNQPFEPTAPSPMPGGWSHSSVLLFTALTVGALLTVVTEYAESSRFCFLLRFLVTFMFLETGLYFGLETHPLAVLMLIVFWIGSLIITLGTEAERRNDRQRRAAVSKKTISVSAGSPQTAIDSALVLLLTASAVIGLGIGIVTNRYVRSERLNRTRDRIIEAYRNFTIYDFTGLLSRINIDGGPNVISDLIDLKHNSDLHFTGQTVLEAEVDPSVRKDHYYLRGMVRNEYTGDGWALRTGDYRHVRDLLKTLADSNRMPQTLWHSAFTERFRLENGKFPVVNWTLRAKRTETMNYLPYQALVPEGAKYSYDTEISLENRQKYDFMTVNNALCDVDDTFEFSTPPEEENILQYESFVQSKYLSVPDNDAMARIKADFYRAYSPDGQNLSRKLDMIRSYIWNLASYDTRPGDFPDDADFAEYFLYQKHRGYCAHYATAGVLLCRMCGIPARYVQGYVVARDDFVLKNAKGQYQLAIPDHRAHAWAEIYINGFGWIPYEFTEGIDSQWRATAPQQTEPPQTTTAASRSQRTTTTTATTTVSGTTASDSRSSASDSGFRLPAWAIRLLKVLGIVLAVLAVIGAIILLWRQHHFRTVRRRSNAMRQKDTHPAGTASYAFLVRLLHMQGIDRGNAQYDQFAETAEESCDLLESGTLTRAIDLQKQSVFSKEGISEAEASELCTTAEKLAAAMYEKADRRHRFVLRWFRHIVR